VADPDVRFFFLVAGYDYEGGGSDKGLAFGRMCTGRVRERISHINNTLGDPDALVTTDTVLRFIRFSVETGKIEVIDRTFVAGRKIKKETVDESEWKPLSSIGTGDKSDPATFVSKGPFRAIDRAADYEHLEAKFPTFKHDPSTRDVMSIVDVYRSVRGAPAGGAILELSFFSHGWIEGPILANSSDLIRDPKLRDPDDKDGRAALDFNISMGEKVDDTVTSASRIFSFMGSFNFKAGVMRVWGCSFDIENPVIRAVVQQERKLAKAGTPLTDDTVIDFHLDAKWTGRYRLTDLGSLFFPVDVRVVDFSRKLSDVKKFLRRRLARSYAYQFTSNSIGQSARGALPGTEGDDEKTGFRLMKVCAKVDPLECPNGFADTFELYRKHLGIAVDDHGYGIFDKATVQKLAADIKADGP
jgi:hypothetical protein